MLVPLSWIKEFVQIPMSPQELADRLTIAGLEVDSMRTIGEDLDPQTLVAAKILSVRKHPDADRLAVLELDAGGSTPEQVVTGAPNIVALANVSPLPTVIVPLAKVGASVRSPDGKDARITLKAAKLRGVQSNGMLCSQRELGISDEHEGIYILPDNVKPGTPLRDVLSDTLLEIAILPDAARCLSIVGVAKELASIIRGTANTPEPPTLPKGKATSEKVNVSITDPSGYRFSALVIKGVKIGPSPRWMQERLTKCGVRPISNIVDITNYVMLEWGQPSHAYDYQLLRKRAGTGPVNITVRAAKKDETMVTLDGTTRTLPANGLVIADDAGAVAVAGVMGGRDTEINDQTTDILLEVASFERGAVRRGMQALKLSSEASYRFSRGIPQRMVDVAQRRIVQLVLELAGGYVEGDNVDCYPVPQKDEVIFITPSEVKRQLGLAVPAEEIASILTSLHFAVETGTVAKWPDWKNGDGGFGLSVKANEPLLRCVAPWYRLDVRLPADVVEEVARMIGFDKLEPTLLAEEMPRVSPDPVYEFEDRVRQILIGCGLQETICYALTTAQLHADLGVGPASESDAHYVTLANPLNSERKVMRRSMMIGGLETVNYNKRFTDRIAIFEIGRVYLPEKGDSQRPLEQRRLSITLSGPREQFDVHSPTAPQPPTEPFGFYDLSGIIQTLVRKVGLSNDDWRLVPRAGDGTFTGRSATLLVRGKECGVLGELNPFAQKKTSTVESPIYLAEVQLDVLTAAAAGESRKLTVNRFQPVIEDFSFAVNESVLSDDVVRLFREAARPLEAEVNLIGIYRGSNLPTGQKSLTYRVTYRHPDHAPSEAEVNAARKAAVEQASKAFGAALRGG